MMTMNGDNMFTDFGIFAAQCYANAAYAVTSCLSVCHIREFCHIFKFFSPTGSQTILVFPLPNVMAIFRRGPPLTWALNAGGIGKLCNSRPIFGFIACCQHCDCQVLSTWCRRTMASCDTYHW